jgi:hypothetical protein
MFYLYDQIEWPGTVGNSQTGVTVSYGSCQDSPVLVLTINVLASGLTSECCLYTVAPHPQTGEVRAMDCSGNWYAENATSTFINGYPWRCDAAAGTSTWQRIRSLSGVTN